MLQIRIKQLRKEAHLSQIEFANFLKCAQGTLSNWERGEREPDAETIGKIADYFGVTTDYLYGRSDTKKIPIAASGNEDIQRLHDKLQTISADHLSELNRYLDYLLSKE